MSQVLPQAAFEDVPGRFAELTQSLLGRSTWHGESILFSRVNVARLCAL